MTQFCRKFFREEPHDVASCPQCSKAQAEIEQENLIQVDGPLYTRSEEEQAALDCHGQP